MATKKTKPTVEGDAGAAKPKRKVGLPEVLERHEVLLACFYRLTVCVYTDKPAVAIEALRAAMPEQLPAAHRRAAAGSLWNNVGVVHRSEQQNCLWFRQGSGAPYRVNPSHVPEELREHITVEEPSKPIRTGHAAEQPRE